MDDFDISFSSHVELSELEKTTTQTPKSGCQQELVATMHWRHRILSVCFAEWRARGKVLKDENIRQLKIAQRISKWKRCTFFRIWKSRFANRQKFQDLGNKLRIAVYLNSWRNSVRAGFIERKRFMKFLLIRRSIYQDKYLSLWRHFLRLKRKHKKIATNADALLMFKVVKAFRIGVQRRKHEREQRADVKMTREFYQEKTCFKHWRMQLRYKRLSRMVVEVCNGMAQYTAFSVWKDRKHAIDVQRRKRDAVRSVPRKFAMRIMFRKWHTRFYGKCTLFEIEQDLTNIRRKRILSGCLSHWISKFNQNGYLSSCEKDILRKRRAITLQKYFGTWHSIFTALSNKYEFARSCAAEYNERRQSKFFLIWKTRYAQANFDRTMMRKAFRRLRLFTLRRSFLKWKDKFNVHHNEKMKNVAAIKFRVASLKMKAFASFKIHAKQSVLKKNADDSAAEHYVFQLQKRAMRCWRRLHAKTIRRYVMITAVLKNWAHNVQLRQLKKWRQYKDKKRASRAETDSALDIYNQRCLRLAFTGFVFAAQRTSEGTTDFSEEEDLLVSNLDDNEPSIIQEHKLTRDTLAAPKRPSFLGAASKIPVQEKTPEAEYEELAVRFAELKVRLETCDPSEKPETLREFQALMDRIAVARSRIVEC